ncbi:unnamed protein product [Linum tenue]|uniref:Uncharacterized protein n=1 Tax=Linum tenue TaxID=586396 RepID=A0AAV0LJ37_9ROSI|nr:unnamed protein product [Linum tenue]
MPSPLLSRGSKCSGHGNQLGSHYVVKYRCNPE